MAKEPTKLPEHGRGSRKSEDLKKLLGGEVTATDLAQLFEIGVTSVRQKLLPLNPVRLDGLVPVYRFRDAASLLAKLPEDVVARVMRLNHMDLPPMLRKEYWTGQAQMLKVKEAEGELFQTATVIEYVGLLLKAFRMSILLMSDSIERDTSLTPRQRDALKLLQDSALENARVEAARLFAEKFNDPAGQPGGGRDDDEPAELSIEDQAADL